MNRSALRLLPAAASFALVLFAATAPALRAREAAPAAANLTGCDASVLSSADGQYLIPPLTGVRQPFDGTVPVAACSLAVDYTSYSSSQLSILEWDPLTLLPDPTSVALRSRTYNYSELQYNHARANFNPPIVVQSVADVAEPNRTTLVLDYKVTDSYNYQGTHFWVDGPVGMPDAYSYSSPILTAPLAGPHPVLAATFCPPADGLLPERVVQSVITASSVYGYEPYEMLQRFQVPQRVVLHRIELAFCYNGNGWPVPLGLVAILSGASMPTPTSSLPSALVQADFQNFVSVPSTWGTHYAFDHQITLEPDRDYWLLVRTANMYPLFARALTGTESAAFQSRIGPLYTRSTPAGAWIGQTSRALCFRAIGEPAGPPLAVTPVLPRGLRLAIEPNPAVGAAMVRWTGAQGSVRLEVLDPRGRRVASYGGGGAEGNWMWRGARDDGQAFAPGVYFVRAVDGAGAQGVARVVLIR
jgi:hypothetical protein